MYSTAIDATTGSLCLCSTIVPRDLHHSERLLAIDGSILRDCLRLRLCLCGCVCFLQENDLVYQQTLSSIETTSKDHKRNQRLTAKQQQQFFSSVAAFEAYAARCFLKLERCYFPRSFLRPQPKIQESLPCFGAFSPSNQTEPLLYHDHTTGLIKRRLDWRDDQRSYMRWLRIITPASK